MIDSDFNGYEPEPLDEIFAEYKPALGTKPLLDVKSLEAIYRQPVPPAILLSSSRNGWRAAAGPGFILLWASMLFSLVWLDASYHASTRHASAFAAQPASLLVQPRAQSYASSACLELQRIASATIKSVSKQQETPEQSATPAYSMFGGAALALPNIRPLTFRVSKFEYDANGNLDSDVAHDPALGPGWQVADWNDLVDYSIGHPIQDVIDSLHWRLCTGSRYDDSWLVRWNGRSTFLYDTARHFFVSRWDGNVPSTWLAHAGIDHNRIALGSWPGMHYPILAVRKKDFH